jgi:hypothetical protein
MDNKTIDILIRSYEALYLAGGNKRKPLLKDIRAILKSHGVSIPIKV